MKRPTGLALALLIWASCSGDRLAVQQPPPSPTPQVAERSDPAPRPTGEASAYAPEESLEIAELAAREIEAALEDEGRRPAGDSNPEAPGFSLFEAPVEPGQSEDPEQPALEAEQAALLDELVAEEIPIPPDATLSERREIRPPEYAVGPSPGAELAGHRSHQILHRRPRGNRRPGRRWGAPGHTAR